LRCSSAFEGSGRTSHRPPGGGIDRSVAVTPLSNNMGGLSTQGYGSFDRAGFTGQLSYYFKRPK